MTAALRRQPELPLRKERKWPASRKYVLEVERRLLLALDEIDRLKAALAKSSSERSRSRLNTAGRGRY